MSLKAFYLPFNHLTHQKTKKKNKKNGKKKMEDKTEYRKIMPKTWIIFKSKTNTCHAMTCNKKIPCVKSYGNGIKKIEK